MTLSSKRNILCSRDNAIRTAYQITNTRPTATVIRTASPLQPFRVVEGISKDKHAEVIVCV